MFNLSINVISDILLTPILSQIGKISDKVSEAGLTLVDIIRSVEACLILCVRHNLEVGTVGNNSMSIKVLFLFTFAICDKLLNYQKMH